MNCPACGTPNEAGRKFCGECGSRLTAICASCGAVNSPTARFCGDCGSRLATEPGAEPGAVVPGGGVAATIGGQPARTTSLPAPVAERRVVTVLFADMVGFTALSDGRDAEAVRELLTNYFDLAALNVAFADEEDLAPVRATFAAWGEGVPELADI